MNEAFNDLQDWVTKMMYRGHYMFSKEDALAIGLPITPKALNNSLMRLGKRGEIMSPWQNFYVIVPIDYRLKGIVPPSFYMDSLMKFLGRDYYVALLTAASLQGAGHQRVMVFQTVVNGGCIRSGVKNGSRLNFTVRKILPMEFVHQVKTESGMMNVSDAELTALDIVAEEVKVGGLSRCAEVLIELSEVMKWEERHLKLLEFFSSAAVQRLGYLLDYIEEKELADGLYNLLKKSGKVIRKIPLKQCVAVETGMPVNDKWKVIENYELDIDDI